MSATPVSERWNLVASLTFVTAFILSSMSEYRCDFVEFESKGGASEPLVRKFGMWSFQSIAKVISPSGTFLVETCSIYPSVNMDPIWTAARAFVTLSSLFALFILFSKLFQSCSQKGYSPSFYVRNGYGQLAPLLLLTGIFQAFTLLFLDSSMCKDNPLLLDDETPGVTYPESCRLGRAGKMSISAAVFWIVCGLAAWQEKKAWQAEREAYEERREARLAGRAPGDLLEPLNPEGGEVL